MALNKLKIGSYIVNFVAGAVIGVTGWLGVIEPYFIEQGTRIKNNKCGNLEIITYQEDKSSINPQYTTREDVEKLIEEKLGSVVEEIKKYHQEVVKFNDNFNNSSPIIIRPIPSESMDRNLKNSEPYEFPLPNSKEDSPRIKSPLEKNFPTPRAYDSIFNPPQDKTTFVYKIKDISV